MGEGADVCGAVVEGLQGAFCPCAPFPRDVTEGWFPGRGREVALREAIANGVQLTPFVSKTVKPLFGLYQGHSKGPRDPQVYLDRWKAENGVD